ncbi:hypothetical protein [Corynebacterium aquatimens]|uniref:Uncharacterized protein n=1 Tax=Corynebacterium aquatimens TaxID=1190508 RepID=A0A931DYI3_9CORY|nr:hypothetical protein [Corynebacterium aquatimens]MBG6121354.1 hypothetical protein [Corynebacterium aquatimens]
MKFRRVGDSETMQNQNPIPATVIKVNHEFAGKTFLFPSTVMAKATSPFLLSHVDDEDIIRAAKRVSDSKEALTREEIAVRKDKLDTKRSTDAEVELAPVAEDVVIKELTRRVFGQRGCYPGQEERDHPGAIRPSDVHGERRYRPLDRKGEAVRC